MTARSFKGIWIPREIWEAKTLSIHEKVMLAEIDSLDNGEGCFATNGYFGKFFGLTNERISQIINALGKKGVIKIEVRNRGNIPTRLLFFNYEKVYGHPKLEIVGEVPAQPEGEDIGIIYPFGNQEFIGLWKIWKDYLKDIGKAYKGRYSEQSALQIIGTYSETEAREMIKKAMANNWKSFYPLSYDKGNSKGIGSGIDIKGIGDAVSSLSKASE
jgi:hypothetical protein